MKLATTSFTAHVPALPRPSVDAMYRMAGLGAAAGVPALFWCGAAWGIARLLGVSLGAPALAAVAVVAGGISLIGASLVMSNRR